MSTPYPVIPQIRNQKDIATALDNIRSYFAAKTREDAAALAAKNLSASFLKVTSVDLSSGDFVIAPGSNIETIYVSTGSATNSIIGPNTPGKTFQIINNDAVNPAKVKVAGMPGVSIGPSTQETVRCNGDDYTFQSYPFGNVVGPGLSVDSNIVEFDGTTGLIIKDGGISGSDVASAISKTSLLYSFEGSILTMGSTILPSVSSNWSMNCDLVLSGSGAITAYSKFNMDSSGTITVMYDSGGGSVGYNVDVGTILCIGTAAAQNPLIIKNRYGSTQNLLLSLWYK
jgi:hypothetical protein